MTQQFTPAQAQMTELFNEIRSQYPALDMRQVHADADGEFFLTEYNSIGILVQGKCIISMQSRQDFEAVRAIALIIAQQEADNAMENSLNEQARELEAQERFSSSPDQLPEYREVRHPY